MIPAAGSARSEVRYPTIRSRSGFVAYLTGVATASISHTTNGSTHFIKRLPDLADEMDPLITEALALSTGWDRKLAILEALSDVLDRKMVESGIISL